MLEQHGAAVFHAASGEKKVWRIQQLNIISPILDSSASEKMLNSEHREKYRADLKLI